MALQRIQLESIASLDSSAEKVKQFESIIYPYLGIENKSEPNVQSLKLFISFIVDNIGESDTSTSKPILNNLSLNLEKIEEDYNDSLMIICKHFIDAVRNKYSYFVESLINCSKLLAELHQANSEYRSAGSIMASIDTEDQYISNAMSMFERCDWRIKTAEYFLADEDNTSATQHIQKCRRLLRDLPDNNQEKKLLDLRHKTCYSRILDSERKFLAASINYMELSQMDNTLINENDLLVSLNNSINCAILAKAGGPRTRVLQMLYRDERSRNLKNFKILEKMTRGRILSQKEQSDFSKTLSEHHKAELSGGLTVLQKAVYEHNMLSSAKLYKNIRMEELSKLLGVNATQTEDLARVMIQEGRMKATIDQVDGIIEFDNDENILLDWDSQIQEICMQINDIVDIIQADV